MTYTPGRPPSITSVEDLLKWVQEEFNKIAQQDPEITVQFEVLNVAPGKPRDGMVVFADGTNWNPGAGRGLYERRAGAWVKL